MIFAFLANAYFLSSIIIFDHCKSPMSYDPFQTFVESFVEKKKKKIINQESRSTIQTFTSTPTVSKQKKNQTNTRNGKIAKFLTMRKQNKKKNQS